MSGRVLRKRKQPELSSLQSDHNLQKLLELATKSLNVVVFSGSGLSVASGMSMFSTKGGLYERAQRRFKVQDGKKLFTYQFYEKQKLEAMAFFSEIYAEAVKAVPGPGHWAIAAMARAGSLRRHYTLNIDGLSAAAGLSTWHPSLQPRGEVVEMHGNIRQMVCVECHQVQPLTAALLRRLKAKQHIACPASPEHPPMRCRIMLYDDAEDDAITPDDVFDLMEEDVQAADLILWVGISFEQSASTSYFRRARAFLHSIGRLGACAQAVINPSEESLWNLTSACSNMGGIGVLEVLGGSDEVLPLVASKLSAARQSVPDHAPGQPAPLNSAPAVAPLPAVAPAPSAPTATAPQALLPSHHPLHPADLHNGHSPVLPAHGEDVRAAEPSSDGEAGPSSMEGALAEVPAIDSRATPEDSSARSQPCAPGRGGGDEFRHALQPGVRDLRPHDGTAALQKETLGAVEQQDEQRAHDGRNVRTSSPEIEDVSSDRRLADCMRPNQTMGLV